MNIELDLDTLLQTVDGDWDLFKEVVGLYFADAPLHMLRIQQAIKDDIAAEVREAAHSLKGASGAFGKNRVYDLAYLLEQAGQSGDLTQALDLWQKLSVSITAMEDNIRVTMQKRGVSFK